MNSILIVDDEAGIRTTLSSVLEDEGYRVTTAEDAIEALRILEEGSIDLVFLDVLLPRMGGLEALGTIKKSWSDIEVIMISGHANVDMAVRAVKQGAFDFLEKPLSLDKILTVTKNALALKKLKHENLQLKQQQKIVLQDIVGNSGALQKVKELIHQAANTEARVLITGENGTGKELVARAIHGLSSRQGGPFVTVNCAAIPETLIESELFGHEKGAFTDAISSRKGRFEQAHGGTLFLDEIGDMSLAAQAKVLRAIQEQKIERLGGEGSITVDVRIIAATNKDLEQACKEGTFREDLFFRLNVIPIHLPPLRDRPEDIPLLLHHFLKELHATPPQLSSEALETLQTYSWPGNIRELKNFAERLAIFSQKGVLSKEEILSLLQPAGPQKTPQKELMAAPQNRATLAEDLFSLPYNEAKEAFEKHYLEYHLAQNQYIIAKTAEAIGIYPSNLHAKIKKHGIRTEP
ncbi:sigma-54 dependent transcriptional regulator [Treponema sp. J25]|uniref:sigma-54-dependent transcriptional regulator n=1 Tax=Treponema sp. J25 TaxID=2094121 RepID=UPI001052778A|nr:sigma-54 dependent transcriptional regulator [Treponema sp. J25]TCW61675.1 Fis family transcriptional regulator [Treponema sp. J25]